MRDLLTLLDEELWRQMTDSEPSELPWWALELRDDARTRLSGITPNAQSPGSGATEATDRRLDACIA